MTKGEDGSSSSYFDWHALGVEAGICFNAIPSRVTFLNGPLQDGQTYQVQQRQQRRPRQLQVEETAEEQRPETVQGNAASKQDADQLSAIEKSMKDLGNVLKKRVDATYKENKRKLLDEYGDQEIPKAVTKKLKKYGVEICALQFLINPESFTQTVENIFHYSFLIKKGSAAISLRETKLADGEASTSNAMFGAPGPVVKYCTENKERTVLPRQAILTLTMKDWRDLCRAYNITKGDLPNRTGSKHARPTATPLSQASATSNRSDE